MKQEYLTKLKGRKLIYLINVACSIAFILFGYEQGSLGGVLGGPAFTKQFPSINTTSGNGNPRLQGFVVGSYNIGCWLGALMTVYMGEKLGRKRTIMVGCTILAIGTAIQCSAYSIPQLVVGRIITGTGNGVITSTIPVWHSELCKAKSRGSFITIELSTNSGGVAVAYWIDYGMSYVNNGAQWRFPIALQIFFALSTIALLTFLPETPRWLMSHDMADEAMDVLQKLNIDEEPGTAEKNHLEIWSAIQMERQAQKDLGGKSAFRLIFTNGEQRFFYRTFLGVWGMVMLQMTGINLITYYAPYIFIKSVGFSEKLSSLMSGFLNLTFYGASLIPIFIIDRVGRRTLLLTGLGGMTVCMFVFAGATSVVSHSTGILATVALFAYDFFFGIGWTPGPWLLASEYAPLMTRSQSAALSTSACWIFTFLIAEITPVTVTNLGWKTYIIFGMLNLAFMPIVYFFYPETKGKTLEQIDFLFTGSKVRIDMSLEELEEISGQQMKAVQEQKIETQQIESIEA